MGASFLQSRTASKVKAIIDANKDTRTHTNS